MFDPAFARADLDAQYDTSKQLPDGNVGAYFADFDAASDRARASLTIERDIAYGSGERETFDFFPTVGGAQAPLFVWIHGGYWRRMSKDQFSFVAAPVVAAGGAVAILNYPLAPGPSLDEIVDAVDRGFTAAVAHARARDIDVARTYVGGHSVGAQLAATVAARHTVAGMLVVSGLYDLEPIRRSYINEWIAMDEATAHRHSPLQLPPHDCGPLVAAVGAIEGAAFAEQQRRYVEAWRAWGGDAREIDAPNHNHFSIVLELGFAERPLTLALLEMMKLA